MGKKVELNQKISNIIYEFFDGDIYKITKSKIIELYNDPVKNRDFQVVGEKELKELRKIEKVLRSKKDIRIILKPKEEKKEKEITQVKTEEKLKPIEYKDFQGDKFVSYQRKAFVDFINNDFYKKITKETKKNELKIYQNFVKGYLGLETPYRGLLVYHGLGTGKTATAVSTAEGLSENMDIFTLLPASLETNFINEVKMWGEDLFDLNDNNWIFVSEKEIYENEKLMRLLREKYKVTPELITKIYNKSRKGNRDIEKGFWIISDDTKRDIKKIKTFPSKEAIEKLDEDRSYLKKNNRDTDIIVKRLDEGEIIQLKNQIDELILLKYNFIHYNPFPSVKSSTIKEFLDKEEEEEEEGEEEEINLEIEGDVEYKTNNQKLVKKLEDKLKENQKTHYIDSPFYNEVIIIDEIHNFVRQVVNNRGPSKIFYNWIINAKNIKLVCLSGTPIINRPSEIAVLFNMIRGLTKRYNFTIKATNTTNTNEIYQRLKNIFYKKDSPIYQINVRLVKGKILVSFMQNNTRFESVMNPDNKIVYTIQYQNHDFNDFMKIIYEGLHQEFEPDSITPSQKVFEGLSEKNVIDIIKGNENVFDTDANVKFNVYRKLFTIDTEKGKIDLTNNDYFMDYFFEDTDNVPEKKRVLLKRMLMGLVSYYPIDRSSIVSMPEIIIPKENVYPDYSISKKIKIELCPMSEKQFIKYWTAWQDDRIKGAKFTNKSMYSNDIFDYHINTRRICNMVYNNEKFRTMKKNKGDTAHIVEKKKEYEDLYQSGSLKLNEGLKLYSPKFYRILNNISRFTATESKGKVLFYSDFRQDSGAEIFELILQANGYSKFYPKQGKNKKLRYTFITGVEKVEGRKINLENFNDIDNIYGEYIQIMIISGAGAEGISLTGVRQVHILEPYWNFVRIEQVFGRAIRIESHKDLPPSERNVEQYLYLSSFPEGNNINDIYKSIRQLGTWSSVPEIEGNIDLETNRETFELIQKINQVKTQDLNETQDQKLLFKMERKYRISQTISDIIKESSVDCLQTTRDDINIHHNCLQFDKKLQDETSYFPGMTADKLSMVDKKQLEAKFSYFMKPNIYIVSALQEGRDIYVYYRLNNTDGKEQDIRYIRDNGKIIGILDLDLKYFFLYKGEGHELDEKMGTRLSVYQEVFFIDDDIVQEANENEIFPKVSEITKDLFGYKIKYNITERFYFYPIIQDKPIMRIYDYDNVESNNFNTTNMSPIVIHNKKLYQVVD